MKFHFKLTNLPPQEEYSHPLSSFIDERQNRDVSYSFNGGIDFVHSVINTDINLYVDGTFEKSFNWDIEANEVLLSRGVRGIDSVAEVQRTVLTMKEMFKPIELTCGSGYFKALLVYILKESDLAQDEGLSSTLSEIRENKPYEGRNFDDLVGKVTFVISEQTRDLNLKLSYSSTETEAILAKAIGIYLDMRYSVTALKEMGWT